MNPTASVNCPFLILAMALAGLGACSSTKNAASKPEKGPKGTIAYLVEVESSEPGVRIEADQEYVGVTPCTLKIFGDKDGTFHNFVEGSDLTPS